MVEAFTNDECLELIYSIKKYEFLYNPYDKHYKNKVMREQAWNDVISKVGKPVGLCKRKWDLLRQRFIRCHKKQKKLKNNAVKEETWVYFKLLDFLHVILPKK
ncbi:unnamed protein product [Phyllotreta striolata]|uniref:MADF domain-containing protein n=1 Tax=Phyllotreta striolata TaxID=444603 RepID=A0A9N9XQY0_PHYSR|nr:unnamed protein product [Phyllotreta striolata]